MDGLIPMAFRAMKKNRTRRRYECLSSGSGFGSGQSYDVSDFFPTAGKPNYATYLPSVDCKNEIEGSGHRRRWSVTDVSSLSCREGRSGTGGYDLSHGGAGEAAGGGSFSPPRQLVRFRSHRFLSCISGE